MEKIGDFATKISFIDTMLFLSRTVILHFLFPTHPLKIQGMKLGFNRMSVPFSVVLSVSRNYFYLGKYSIFKCPE